MMSPYITLCHLAGLDEITRGGMPRYMPTLTPPRPWARWNSGGYVRLRPKVTPPRRHHDIMLASTMGALELGRRRAAAAQCDVPMTAS